MSCNCKTMICSTIEQQDTAIILIPNKEVKKLVNTETYGLIISNNIAATVNLPVFIKTNIGNIPVLCKAGNTIYANQLNTRERYPIIYGDMNDNYPYGQFVILSCVEPRAVTAAIPISI